MTALKNAESEVSRLEREVSRWQDEADMKAQELADFEARVGEEMLADESGTAARRLAMEADELRFTISGAQSAARAAARRLRDARWELKSAQAAELRGKAGSLRAEAEQRQARVDELLAQLEEYEGGGWRPYQATREDLVAAGAGGIRLSPRRTPPLFAEADRLDAQAAQLEEQVATEQRQAAVLVPHAEIVWPGGHHKGEATNLAAAFGVNDGIGSAVFEVLCNGQLVESMTLPTPEGRRGVRRLVDGFAGDLVEVRADGQLLASRTVEVPAGEFNDGRGRPLIGGRLT